MKSGAALFLLSSSPGIAWGYKYNNSTATLKTRLVKGDASRNLAPIESFGSGQCTEKLGCGKGKVGTCIHTGTEYRTACSPEKDLEVIGAEIGGDPSATLVACAACECFPDLLSPISNMPDEKVQVGGAYCPTTLSPTKNPSGSLCQCSSGEAVFHFSTLEAKWEVHDSIAKLMGCELASIHTPEEQALAEAELQKYQGYSYQNRQPWETSFAYIGGKVVPEATNVGSGDYVYEWSDGSGTVEYNVGSSTSLNFQNFQRGDPNGVDTGAGVFNEAYLALSLDESYSSGIPLGEWVDFSNTLSPALYKCCAPPTSCSDGNRIFLPDVPYELSKLTSVDAPSSPTCLESCAPESTEYVFSAFEASWEQHDTIAKTIGCELASITDANEQSLAEAEMARYPNLPYTIQDPWTNSFAFIGGQVNLAASDPAGGSYTYSWSDGSGDISVQRDGSTSFYSRFKPGDPNGVPNSEGVFSEPYLALSLDERNSAEANIPRGDWVDFSNLASPAIYKCCGPRPDLRACLATAENPKPAPTPPPTAAPTASPPATPVCSTCLEGGEVVFHFSTLEAKWETHNNIAKLMGCELASIKSSAEQALAEEEIAKYRGFPYQNRQPWQTSFAFIGGKVVQEESDPENNAYSFEWSDGSGKFQYVRNSAASDTVFSNFKPSDPNGWDTGAGVFNEAYLALSLDEFYSTGIPLGEWVDFSNTLSPALYKCCAPINEATCSSSSRMYLPEVPFTLSNFVGADESAASSSSPGCLAACQVDPVFYFSSFETSWEQHDTIAKTIGCELASITDANEQSLAEAEMARYPNLPYTIQDAWTNSFAFIGGQVNLAASDPAGGSYTYSWSDGSGDISVQRDGSTSFYSRFKPGDPNGVPNSEGVFSEPYLALSLDERNSAEANIPRGDWVDFSNLASPAIYKCCGPRPNYSDCFATAENQRPVLAPSPAPTMPEEIPFETLADCLLSTDIPDVVLPGSFEFEQARHCLVWMPDDTEAYPFAPTSAVVQPATAEQVGAAVQCAAAFNHKVSARSGSHSFTAESCSGHVIIDMSLFDSLEVDTSTSVVTFGAGQLHGQLYARLADYDLLLPGGTESMVGIGGLWLGCGRGMYTQEFGLSCDQLRGIEYVDAAGEVKTANANTNADVFWMAKGSGGLFPGIVTKFIAQAAPNPGAVQEDVCYINNTYARVAMEAYIETLDFILDPTSKSYSFVHMDGNITKITFNCYGCNESELGLYQEHRSSTLSLIPFEMLCESKFYTYLERLVAPSWDSYNTTAQLLERTKWPEWLSFWGDDLSTAALNGGMLVPSDFVIGDAVLDEIFSYFENMPGNRTARAYKDFVTLYPTKGNADDTVGLLETAYGGRGTKLCIHYKSEDLESVNHEAYKANMDSFEVALVENAGLPCLGFYNYFDKDIGCATTDDEWLAAFFSDPSRIRIVIDEQDPNGVFFRNRL